MPSRKTTFFRGHELLAGLPREAVDRLVDRSEVVRKPRRSRVWEPLDPGDHVFWLQGGVVKVGTPLEGGRQLTLHLHARGALFGEGPLLTERPHRTFAEIYEDATLYATPRLEIVRLLDRYAAFTRRVSALVADRRERLEVRMGDLLFRTSQARLAALFLELAGEFGVRDSRGIIVNLKLTHKEMASLVGATRETVSFALLDLRREGLVETEGKRVVLLDQARLMALRAEGG